MKITKQLLALFILAISFTSCETDKIELVERDYSNGILISGEGSGAGTGSVSFIAADRTSKFQFIYLSANGQQLGTYLQSIAFTDEKAFVIVDNANTVSVVDKATFIKEGEITTGLSTPRFMTVVEGKGYITNWGSTASETDDFVAVVDLTTNTVEKTIAVGNGPEQIVSKNGKLYVSHKGAFTTNNVVSVIDIATDAVSEITVLDKPDELFFNNSGALVVLSEGRTLYNSDWSVKGHTTGAIQTIDVATNTVTSSVEFAEGSHPSLIAQYDGDLYYYLSGKVFKLEAGSTVLPTTEVLSQFLYGMAISNGELHGVNASFTSQSDYVVYDLDSKEKVYTTKVALGASKIYFVE